MVVKRLAGTFLFSNVFSEESSRETVSEREREREREVCPLESEIDIEVFLLKSECESDWSVCV